MGLARPLHCNAGRGRRVQLLAEFDVFYLDDSSVPDSQKKVGCVSYLFGRVSSETHLLDNRRETGIS